MPKGVEHMNGRVYASDDPVVRISQMPKGVERSAHATPASTQVISEHFASRPPFRAATDGAARGPKA